MSTRSIVNRAKLEAWATRFAEQNASGLTVADWCQQNNISRNSCFYWERKLNEYSGVIYTANPDVETDDSGKSETDIPA